MSLQTVGIIMNGVTGRMGANQHLLRSICAIRDRGGLCIGDNRVLMPEPLLVGRSEAKLRQLAARAGGVRWTTDRDAALSDTSCTVYFDAQVTDARVPAVRQAIAAAKHVYCEKPTATNVSDAYALYRAAKAAGVKHGVVQDKLWLPGMIKLKALIESGFFGRILSVRGEFGYWVFTGGDLYEDGGDGAIPQRPSWNYRSEDGGGIILDMLCHWRYLLDNLFADVRSVSCLGANHIPVRWDESGERYKATADDSCYVTFELDDGVIAQFNSSWCVRVRRDDLLTIQVDGTNGSAVAGLRDCRIQPRSATPRPVWNPDEPCALDYRDSWELVPDRGTYENAFLAQWELFLRHVATDSPFTWDLLEAAKGVQLAECGMESWKSRKWVDISDLET